MNKLNTPELVKRVVKYMLEAVAVILAARYIPQYQLSIREVLMIGATAAITFAILDMYAPVIGTAARVGTGLRIGWDIAAPE